MNQRLLLTAKFGLKVPLIF